MSSDIDFELNADRLREECGVFGIYGHPDAAALTALGLHALQHRGQEAAGIVSFDDLIDACASQLGGLADVVRRGIQRESLERAEAAAVATSLHLQVPALGTAGWQLSGAGMAAN